MRNDHRPSPTNLFRALSVALLFLLSSGQIFAQSGTCVPGSVSNGNNDPWSEECYLNSSCDYQGNPCTANDVNMLGTFLADVNGGPLPIFYPGDTVTVYLWGTFENGTGTDRYAVRTRAEMYLDGSLYTIYNDCSFDVLTPGTFDAILLGPIQYVYGQAFSLKNTWVGWETSAAQCTDPFAPDYNWACGQYSSSKCSRDLNEFYSIVPNFNWICGAFTDSTREVCFFNTTMGGVQPLTYSWNFDDGSAAGTDETPCHTFAYDTTVVYNVVLTVTDSNGVTASATLAVDLNNLVCPCNEYNTPVLVLDKTDVYCAGNCEGTIDMTISGPAPPYDIYWSTGDTTEDLTGLCAGVYYVTVGATPFNCQAFDSIEILSPGSSLSIVFDSLENASCKGFSDGAIYTTVSGGTAPYTYLWSNGDTTEDISGLAAGTYTLTATDAHGCSYSASASISEPSEDLTITIDSTENISCKGFSDGEIYTTASGGTGPYTYAWSAGGYTTDDITGLTAGSYSVTVTDAHGCTASASTTLSEPPLDLTITVDSTENISCKGFSDGEIYTTANGGTAPYTYAWSAGGYTTDDITGLTAGSYSVTVTDAHGCTASASTTLSEPPLDLTITIDSTENISCKGFSDGEIYTTATGGTAPYTYAWSPAGPNADDRTGLTAGSYSVTVTDAHGCTAATSTTLSEPPLDLTITVDSTENISCKGFSDGAIYTTASGGTGPYSYAWSPTGPNSDDRTGLTAGSYSVTVTDAHGCTASASTTLSEPPLDLTITIDSTENISCKGFSDGEIYTTATGGTAPYSYAWSPAGPNSDDRTGLTAGSYSVTVTDAHGCTASASTTLSEPPLDLTITIDSTENISCKGFADGEIYTTAAGGTAPYTYAWSPAGPNSDDRTGLTAGSYSVTVTDAHGCTASASTTLSEPPLDLTITIDSTENISCKGFSDGEIYTTANGGTAPYTYAWSAGGYTTDDITGLTAGSYSVTVTDAHGCTAATSATLSEPSEDLTISVDSTENISCKGFSDGAIYTTASGGTGPYTYAWSAGGYTTDDITGLTAGSYSVTVTDAHGCTASTSATLSEPSEDLTITVDSTENISCKGFSDGAIYTTAAGGTAPYTYAWSPSGPNSDDRTGLTAGSYSVTVTDAHGCTASTSTTLSEPPLDLTIVIDSTENISCKGFSDGEIYTTATGGTAPYTYAWSPSGPNSDDRTGLTAGSYSVTVTDAHGCTASTSATLSEPPLDLTITIDSTKNISCKGFSDGAIYTTAAGGTAPYSYAWSPSGPNSDDRTGLTAGSYSVTVTDAHGCTASTSATLSEPAEDLTITVDSTENISCKGFSDGAIYTTAAGGTGPYSYAWSPSGPNSDDRTGLTAGSYSVTVTDAHGCTASTSATLSEPPLDLTITIDSTKNISCKGFSDGEIYTTATGGTAPYTYAWSPAGPNSDDRTGLTAGSYSVTVTDAHGCTASISATLSEPAEDLTITVDSTENISCKGFSDGAIYTTAAGGTGPYSYAWSPAGPNSDDRTGLTAGSYSVTVTDAHGCTASTSTTLSEPPLDLTITIDSTENISCKGFSDGAIYTTASGGTGPYSYAWSPTGPNSDDRTGLTAGSYSVTVTDAHGCTASTSTTLSEPPLDLTITIDSTENISCKGFSDGAIYTTASGGTGPYSYAWSPTGPNSDDRTGLTAGSYSVTVTDAHGCTASISATLSEPAEDLTITVDSTENISCKGFSDGAIYTTAAGGTGPYSYAWSPSGPNSDDRTGLTAGPYSVTVTDAHGCTAATSATLSEPSEDLTITVDSTENISCKGFSDGAIYTTASGGTGPYSYTWSPSGPNSDDRTGLTAGSYSVTVIDAHGCTASTSATLSEPPLDLTITIDSTKNISCKGFSDGAIYTTATGGTAPYSYAWSPSGPNSDDRTGLTAGSYSVTVTDAHGCTASTSTTLTEPDVLTGGIVVLSNFGFNDPICGINSTNYDQTLGDEVGNVLPTTPNPFCDPNTPYFNIDLTGNPDSVWISDLFSRDGNCCTTTSPDRCVTFEVTLDPNAIGIILSISAGAEPPGALFWELNCSGSNPLDSLVCLNGVGPHIITFCKPGNNANAYKITTVSSPIFPEDDYTRVGCSETYNLVGFSGAGATWNSIYPGASGQYNNYLSCTTCNSPTFIADDNAPPYIDYEICGFGACNGISYCDTFRVYILDSLPDADGYVSCNGEADAAVGVDNLSGGTPPYTFIWSNGDTTQDITGLAAGTYAVTVTDANGCSFTDDVIIGEPEPLEATTSQVNVSCNGGNDGSIDLSVTGGSVPYSYIWSSGDTTEDISNLAAGNYTVTVTDANGCTVSTSATITQAGTLTIILATQTNVSCYGYSNGALDVNITGGTPPYSYFWSPDSVTTQDRSGLSIGTYTLEVTDSLGCFATQSFTITQPDTLTAGASSTNVSCYGGFDGTATVSVTGGTTPYQYLWSNGLTNASISGLAAGTYTVTITDFKGCTATASTTVTQPDALTLGVTPTPVNCFGGSDGALDLTVTGGTPAYHYLWNTGDTTEDLTGLPTGIYTVTVTDANGCSNVLIPQLVSQPQPLSLGFVKTNIRCNGESNGAVDMSVTGGTTPFTYTWSSGDTTEDLTGLTAGTYYITVVDDNGCIISDSVTLTQPNTLSASAGSTNVSCYGGFDGTATVTVTGGTTPYLYHWSNNLTSASISGLVAGSYSVTITDAHGCTTTASTTVTQPGALTLGATPTPVNCFGGSDGSIDLIVTGGTPGYTYHWNNGDTTQDISNLPTGIYTVTVTDAHGCVSTLIPQLVSQPLPLALSFSNTNVKCNGSSTGAIDLSVNGGTTPFTYTWSNGDTTEDLTGLTAGPYSVTVLDNNGCSITGSVLLTQPTQLTVSASSTNVSCNGGSNGTATASVSGGAGPYTYHWSNNAATASISGLPPGTYGVTVTDANGCTATGSTTVTQPSALSLSTTPTAVSCYGGNNGSVGLIVSGGTFGYSYHWNTGDTTQSISNLFSGTYFVTVTDANGCTKSTSASVTQPDSLDLSATTGSVSCYGESDGSIDLSVSGGTASYSYNWSNGATSQDLSGLTAGTYTVTVTDANGCNKTLSATVSQPDTLALTLIPFNVACNGGNTGSVYSAPTGGTTPYSYSWSNGDTTQNISSLIAANYALTVTDANGCSASGSVTIEDSPALNVLITPTNVTCFGLGDGSATAQGLGGKAPYTYQWSTGDTTTTITDLAPGTYTVTVADSVGCSGSKSITITQPDTLTVLLTSTPVSCFGGTDGTITVNITGGTAPYSYNSAALSGGKPAGFYSTVVTDANGCTAAAGVIVSQPGPLTLGANTTPVDCNGASNGAIDLIVTGGTPSCIAGVCYQYTWSNGATSEDLANLAQGAYTVTVTDANGCQATLTVNVPQPDVITLQANVGRECGTLANGSIDLSVTGGTSPYTYNWSSGDSTEDLHHISAGTYTVTVSDVNGCSATDSYVVIRDTACSNNRKFSVKVFLEGPYVSGTLHMHTKLNTQCSVLPLNQPFNVGPWNYSATQNVVAFDSTIVDWVLVSFRTTDSHTSEIYKTAALLKSDGQVVTTSGDSIIAFSYTPADSLYVVVQHRNHMGAMSAIKYGLPASPGIVTMVDFTRNQSYQTGLPPTSGQKVIDNDGLGDVYGLYSGDGDANFDINSGDFVPLVNDYNIFNQYKNGDFNMDCDCNSNDIPYWINNFNLFSGVSHP